MCDTHLCPQEINFFSNAFSVKTFEQNEDVYIDLVLLKYHIFSFITALQKLQKIVTCFPEDKLS